MNLKSVGFPKGREPEKEKEIPKVNPNDRYDLMIRKWSGNYEIPWELVKAVIYQESSFNERAESHCGAKGLMQLMNFVYEPEGIDPFNPEDNIRVGCGHLKKMWNIFGDEKGIERWRYALGSYNGGAGYIIDAQRKTKGTNAKIDKWYHLVLFLRDAKSNGKRCDYLQIAEYVDKVIMKMIDYIIIHISGGNPCSSLEDYLKL